MNFQKHNDNPIIPRTPGTFYSVHVANPDILLFKGKYHLYFRGQSEAGHDQIGVAYSEVDEFDGVNWDFFPDNPVIRVGENPSDFDSGHILDPASVEFDGRVFLYYSSHNIAWKESDIPSYIGLAISEDGTHFKKFENPIVEGTAPEIVLHNRKLHLFYQKRQHNDCFEIYCSQSKDGFNFEEPVKVFFPSKIDGAFDRFSISTVRIWKEGNWFYMMYGGCPKYYDYPSAIGLARSSDLLNWQRYPENPVLNRGVPGTWDEGALWFATVHKKDDVYYLWYEGTGSGLGTESTEAQEATRLCRNEDYGGYAESSFSQIGLATFNGKIPDW